MRPRADEESRLALQAIAFEHPEWDDDDGDRDVVWVGRTRKLKDLVAGKSVEEQGDQLAAFVADAFGEVVAARSKPSVKQPATRPAERPPKPWVIANGQRQLVLARSRRPPLYNAR